MRVQRVVMPDPGLESWTVPGEFGVPPEPVERLLSYLASVERPPNTIKAYAHGLKVWFTFLTAQGLALAITATRHTSSATVRLSPMNPIASDPIPPRRQSGAGIADPTRRAPQGAGS
ncbi:MAG TPA: hypothetical protein VFV66_25340 [Nonomuraea sp.]|nr:hypothetical protein [Nonomuraea sp.]